MKTIKYIATLIVVAIVWSCNSTPNGGTHWGEAEFYSNFLFKKYTEVKMEKTLEFEFNEDALNSNLGDIRLVVVERMCDGNVDTAKGINVYKNDKLCPDNIFLISKNDREVKLGISFTKEATGGNHILCLRAIEMGGLDRIDDIELGDFVVRKIDIMNPLAKGVMWTLIILVAMLIGTILFVHTQNPKFKIGSIQVEYFNNEGESRDHKRKKIRGCYKVVFTCRNSKQGFFDKLFKGRMLYITDGFWEQDLILLPKTNRDRKNKIRIQKNPYSAENSIEKGTLLEMNNTSSGEKTTLLF